jgi:cysteine desulfurase family protein (TIGR01976 family)
MTPAQLQWMRAQFPALATTEVFLDNAGGSQVLARVAERVRDYLLTSSVQLGASYACSLKAAEKVRAARRAIAEWINAPHDESLVMGGSTTLLLFQLTSALMPVIRPGDEIIVTDVDHEANIGAWKRLTAAGAVLKVWRVDRDSLRLELDGLSKLLSARTRWVAMTAASNVLGTINPVAEVARRVHAAGARLVVDAVAYAPHRLVDVQALEADAVVFSFYKVFGPHYAVLWVERELLLALPGLNHFFIAPDEIPYKLQPGNVNFELSFGAAGIADYLVEAGERCGGVGSRHARMAAAFEAFAAHEDTLSARLLDFLAGKHGVRVLGEPKVAQRNRVPTISFVRDGVPSETIVRHTDRAGLGIRFGDFYAAQLIDALGLRALGGVVRVSALHYNTREDIDRLVACLEPIL